MQRLDLKQDRSAVETRVASHEPPEYGPTPHRCVLADNRSPHAYRHRRKLQLPAAHGTGLDGTACPRNRIPIASVQ
jgi:hypothetical protein